MILMNIGGSWIGDQSHQSNHLEIGNGPYFVDISNFTALDMFDLESSSLCVLLTPLHDLKFKVLGTIFLEL